MGKVNRVSWGWMIALIGQNDRLVGMMGARLNGVKKFSERQIILRPRWAGFLNESKLDSASCEMPYNDCFESIEDIRVMS